MILNSEGYHGHAKNQIPVADRTNPKNSTPCTPLGSLCVLWLNGRSDIQILQLYFSRLFHLRKSAFEVYLMGKTRGLDGMFVSLEFLQRYACPLFVIVWRLLG